MSADRRPAGDDGEGMDRANPGAAGPWALFLDIDGTLVELAPRPELVRVPEDLPGLLAALAQDLGGALALVSGRALATIDGLIPGGLDAAGTHGAEWRLAGQVGRLSPPDPARLAAVLCDLRAQAGTWPGLLIEAKPGAIALHYRMIPEREPEVLALAGRCAHTLGRGYRLQPGKQVVELLPAAAGKGAAIRRFMAAGPYAGRIPVFAGDDLTDEDGFAVVEALGGIGIRVGSSDTPTRASRRLASPAALRARLAAFGTQGPEALWRST